MHRLSGCPGCAEPLEDGDRFCGVCGYAVTAPPPAPAADHPTIPLPPSPGGVPAPAPAPAPAGDGYDAAEPAPGWGSVASAAPTLVGDPADWAVAPPDPGTPYGTGGEPAYGTPPAPPAPPAAAPAPAARYGHPGRPPGEPGDAGDTGPESSAGPAEEHHRYDGPQATPQGATSGHEGSYAAPRGTDPGHGDPYGTPQGAGQGGDGTPPEGTPAGGKTCVACRAGHVDTDGYCEHCGHAQPRERDHQEEELGSVAAVSDRGLRHHRNEDSFAVAATALPDGSAATVAIVCDGVSSASRPDEASAAAAAAANEALLDALPRGAHPQEAMHEAILAAATAVNALAPETPGAQNAPACTLVGAVVSSGLLTIGWVGDSRAYWVPDDRAALPRRLTEDDSWAAQMVAAGLMGEAEAYADVRAHAITGWLGADAYDLEPHTATFKPDHPGVVVVCTDGLWNYAESARDIARVLPADAAVRPLHSAQVLVGHALDGGGHDNVTVAIVPFAALPEPRPEPGAGPEAEPEPRAQA
ncbi:protein phosphatase 2C domain-containing protein [Streptomyces sp. H27-S2]|nr:protein phosphatase 2C domain-containing protein [Streptomyces sp. H27-S2]MCY0948894.1 protein phosphatase 2C domain-containing protein [Streptomyces sp. H27-S2]